MATKLVPPNSPGNVLVSVPVPQPVQAQPKQPAQPQAAPQPAPAPPPSPFVPMKTPPVMFLPNKMASIAGPQQLDRGQPLRFEDSSLYQYGNLFREWQQLIKYLGELRAQNAPAPAYLVNQARWLRAKLFMKRGEPIRFSEVSPELLDVPDVEQSENGCGAAAAMSVIRYFGAPGPSSLKQLEKELGTNVDHSTRPQAIADCLVRLGLQVEMKTGMTIEDLQRAWKAGSPVIVPVQDYCQEKSKKTKNKNGHYLVILGVDLGLVFAQDSEADRLLTEQGGDSIPGRVMIKQDKFLECWHDTDIKGNKYERFGIIVSKPKGAPEPMRRPGKPLYFAYRAPAGGAIDRFGIYRPGGEIIPNQPAVPQPKPEKMSAAPTGEKPMSSLSGKTMIFSGFAPDRGEPERFDKTSDDPFGGGAVTHVGASSPNMGEMHDAEVGQALAGKKRPGMSHQEHRMLVQEALRTAGVSPGKAKLLHGYGEWAPEGGKVVPEDTIVHVLHDKVSPEQTRHIAAHIGLNSNQLAVMAFRGGEGQDLMHRMFIPGKSLSQIRQALDLSGKLPYRTIIPAAHGTGHHVIVYNGGGDRAIQDELEKIADATRSRLYSDAGTGEFIGDGRSRSAARRAYRVALAAVSQRPSAAADRRGAEAHFDRRGGHDSRQFVFGGSRGGSGHPVARKVIGLLKSHRTRRSSRQK